MTSERLAEQFQLHLAPFWAEWFSGEQQCLLPGLMRQRTSAEQLCEPAPSMIWPGFMLPDSLPVLGNEYGDWICARVTEDNLLGELLYWYHGGGDWIPVGTSLGEAVLHDAVDQFRPIRKQMLRGAAESRMDTLANVLMRLEDKALQKWLTSSLPATSSSSTVSRILSCLAADDYHKSLKIMSQAEWSPWAVRCDLLDSYLQLPVQCVARRELADAANVAWFPDFIHILFDVESATEIQRGAILAAAQDVEHWPEQDWESASKLARKVQHARKDLGWSAAVLGWSLERKGDIAGALEVYLDSLEASAFTEQGVRFNSHAEADEWSKFSVARLVAHADTAREMFAGHSRWSSYAALLLQPHRKSLLVEVSQFWQGVASEAEQQGDFEGAYQAYFQAGWDLGVSRLTEYHDILASLVRCAARAGWEARAAVAQVHLNCLAKRMG